MGARWPSGPGAYHIGSDAGQRVVGSNPDPDDRSWVSLPISLPISCQSTVLSIKDSKQIKKNLKNNNIETNTNKDVIKTTIQQHQSQGDLLTENIKEWTQKNSFFFL